MTSVQLYDTLRRHGATLSLDPQGRLHITPAAIRQQFAAVIPQHLCFLLTAAATEEAGRLFAAHGMPTTQPRGMVSTDLLNAACLGGDVVTCRQAARDYVQAWKAWLTGEAA